MDKWTGEIFSTRKKLKKKVKNKYRSMKVGEKNDVRNYSKNGAKKLLGHYTDHNTRKRKKRDV